MRKLIATLPLLSLMSAPLLAADDINALGSLSQSQFRALSEDLGAAVGYKALSPAEPLGITGIDLGVESHFTTIENTEAFDLACGGCDADTLVVPKLHLHKGLPASFDVGVMLGSVPGSNIDLSGIELRYAFLDGSMATPALALRGSYSRLDGVDDLKLETTGLELTISKGLAMLTPYAGIGRQWVESDPAASTGLKDESFSQDKMFVGMNVNFGLLNLALEADQTGDTGSYGAKIGFRF